MVLAFYRERQAGPYVHQWQAAAIPPPNTWIQVMTPESLSPLPVTGEGGPLTEWDHGTSDEGSLG